MNNCGEINYYPYALTNSSAIIIAAGTTIAGTTIAGTTINTGTTFDFIPGNTYLPLDHYVPPADIQFIPASFIPTNDWLFNSPKLDPLFVSGSKEYLIALRDAIDKAIKNNEKGSAKYQDEAGIKKVNVEIKTESRKVNIL